MTHQPGQNLGMFMRGTIVEHPWISLPASPALSTALKKRKIAVVALLQRPNTVPSSTLSAATW
jgi:hypothetical protein